ncbi:MAG TPA: hypothetical protein VFO07_15880, partial [Roseiflexaceae bacterium]|nr:hypothetical protein [Roseiflexaceae bacterium]
IAALVTGSFIVETVFRVPGIGRLYINSIFARDYPLIMALRCSTPLRSRRSIWRSTCCMSSPIPGFRWRERAWGCERTKAD